MSIRYNLNDGSVLQTIMARELVTYAPWRGNRSLDIGHVDAIEASLKDHFEFLDHGYKLIKIKELDASDNVVENTYIIDGQHRAEVLKRAFKSNTINPFMDDFVVFVIIKKVSGEAEADAYFKAINHAKPIEWKTDPNLVITKYIVALEEAFMQTKRLSFIRSDTKFPYLQISILRTAFEAEYKRFPLSEDDADIKQFVENVLEWNKSKLMEPIPAGITKKLKDRMERAIGTGFMLAIDPKCEWIHKNR